MEGHMTFMGRGLRAKQFIKFSVGPDQLNFSFAGKTWKKVSAGGHNKNKNIVNFYTS